MAFSIEFNDDPDTPYRVETTVQGCNIYHTYQGKERLVVSIDDPGAVLGDAESHGKLNMFYDTETVVGHNAETHEMLN